METLVKQEHFGIGCMQYSNFPWFLFLWFNGSEKCCGLGQELSGRPRVPKCQWNQYSITRVTLCYLLLGRVASPSMVRCTIEWFGGIIKTFVLDHAILLYRQEPHPILSKNHLKQVKIRKDLHLQFIICSWQLIEMLLEDLFSSDVLFPLVTWKGIILPFLCKSQMVY